MQQYEQYKDSGVAWLGEVPSHWETIQFRRVVKNIKDGTHGTHARESSNYPLLSAKNVFNNGLYISDNESCVSEDDFKLITSNGFPKKNDLLITCVGSVGRCCLYPFNEPMAFQRSVAFLRLNDKAVPKYYKYFVESDFYQEQLKANVKLSIQSGVYLGALIGLLVCLPPLPEQTAIATYLDSKLGEIDTLISKQETLLEKLAEQRTAIITHTVTKGLNPEVEMKNSGVEWLGEVPEHWNIVPIRYLFEFKNNLRVPISAEDRAKMSEKAYPYYGASGIIDYVDDFIFSEDLILVAEDGANLLSRSSPLAFIATGKYWVNNHAHIIKPHNDMLKFWEYLLQIYDFKLLISGSAQPKLTKENLGSILLPNPPLAEQTAIADYLDEQTAQIDRLSERVQQVIDSLKSYRSALITQAVTGKIKVI